jgi:S1-C subfamily serine protease
MSVVAAPCVGVSNSGCGTYQGHWFHKDALLQITTSTPRDSERCVTVTTDGTVGVRILAGPALRAGTGFILKYHTPAGTPKHVIVTAWHVIAAEDFGPPRRMGDIVLSRCAGGKEPSFLRVRGQPDKDLAFLDVEGWPAPHYILQLPLEERLTVGDTVAIPGLWDGQRSQYRMTSGTVSTMGIHFSKSEAWPDLDLRCFVIDVETTRGMSGSPVLKNGHVVGVVIGGGQEHTVAVGLDEIDAALKGADRQDTAARRQPCDERGRLGRPDAAALGLIHLL